MKTYQARSFGYAFVVDDGGKSRRLDPRLDLANHSPTGFAWGYAGSGPAQLAIAILADVYDDETALRYYQRFKEFAIATKHRDAPFSISLDEVLKTVEAIKQETAP